MRRRPINILGRCCCGNRFLFSTRKKRKEKFRSSFSSWRWVREDFVELFFVVFALGRQQIHQCCFDLTGHTRRVSPSPPPTKTFWPASLFCKTKFWEWRKRFRYFDPIAHAATSISLFALMLTVATPPSGWDPEFFFPSAIFRRKDFRIFFKNILLRVSTRVIFIFIFFRKWALTCRLSSAVESFDKLFRLTFQNCQDFCNQPSVRWRHESTEIAKRARVGERESWKTTF